MINYLTCFKCWGGKAVLTYEENRIYKVSCECGCSYTFEHSSMNAANEYHNKMLELHGEIDKNSRLQIEIAELKAERDAAIADVCLACECLTMASGHGLYDGCDCCKWRGQEGGERDG